MKIEAPVKTFPHATALRAELTKFQGDPDMVVSLSAGVYTVADSDTGNAIVRLCLQEAKFVEIKRQTLKEGPVWAKAAAERIARGYGLKGRRDPAHIEHFIMVEFEAAEANKEKENEHEADP